MTTIVLNLGIALLGLALLSAPVLLAATYRALSVHQVLLGLMGSIAVISLVGYCVVAMWATGLVPLLVVGVLLGAILALAAGRAVVLRLWRQQASPQLSGLVVLVIGLFTGLFLVLPGLLALHAVDTNLGLVSNYNTDPVSYAQCSLIMSSGMPAGNLTSFELVQTCHASVLSLINLLSSMTGLSTIETTTPALILISALIPVSLCSLAKSVWPAASRKTILATGVVATISPLIALHAAQGFVAALLAISTASAVLSGSFLIAAKNYRVGVPLVIVGGISGIYGYLEFLAPLTVLAPVVTLATMVMSRRRIGESLRTAIPTLLASGAVILATLPLLLGSASRSFFRERLSQEGAGSAGWPMGPIDVFDAMFWPPGLAESMYTKEAHLSRVFLLGWALFLALLVAICLAAKKPANDIDGRTISIVIIGSFVLAMAGAYWVFGTTSYQSWRIETLVLPLLLSAVLPATRELRGILGSWGRPILPIALGCAVLVPSLAWLPTSTYSVENKTTVAATPEDLLKSASMVDAMNIGTINVRLPNFFQGLAVSGYSTDLTATIVREGDPNTLALVDTCTLTTQSLVTGPHAKVERLVGDYVLIPYPAPCSTSRVAGTSISAFAGLFEPAQYNDVRLNWTTKAEQPAPTANSGPRSLSQGAGGVLVNSARSQERVRLVADVTVKSPSATVTFTFGGTTYPFTAANGQARIDVTLDVAPGSTAFELRTDSEPIEPEKFLQLQGADFQVLPPLSTPSG